MRHFLKVLLLVSMVVIAPSWAAGTPLRTYIYDEAGRLIKTVDLDGTTIEYVYDANGNLLEIRRTSINGIAIFGLSPQQGPISSTVTIQGQSFSATPVANDVRFNGTAATVLSASTSSLAVTVPAGATTGPVTVTVAGQTATSSQPFTVTASPVVSSVTPVLATSQAAAPVVIPVQVTGANLEGSIFAFVPVLSPPPLTVGTVSIDPGGTSATVDVTIGAETAGSFTLVATNRVGSSSVFPSPSNTILVLEGAEDPDFDGLTNNQEIAAGTDPFRADSDGDGFRDGDEVTAGSNPLDPLSLPVNFARFEVSVFNQLDPGAGSGIVIAPPVSVLNRIDPSSLTGFALGVPVSVFNSMIPGGHATSPDVSVENSPNP